MYPCSASSNQEEEDAMRELIPYQLSKQEPLRTNCFAVLGKVAC